MQKNIRPIIYYSFTLIISSIIGSCQCSNKSGPVEYTEVGYTKEGKERLKIISYSVQDSTVNLDAEIRRHAKNQMHTQGHSTTLYYFKGKAPAISHSTISATRNALQSHRPPDKAFVILPNGKLTKL